MSRATKRTIGNISVLTVLVALVAVLAFSAMSPTFLKNDAKLTTEANAGTPIVQAMNTPKPSPTPSHTEKVDPAKEWADDMINLFLNGKGANSFEAFGSTALGAVTNWGAGTSGQLILEVAGEDWEWTSEPYIADDSMLIEVSKEFMASAGFESESLQSVKIISTSGKEYGSYGRDDMTNANPWSQ